MKLLSKKRDGARVSKRYDLAQTPCQRVLASSKVRKRPKEALRRLFWELDPLALLKELEYRQDRFWQYANRPAPQPVDSAISRPCINSSGAEQGVGISPNTLAHHDQPAKREGPRRYRRTRKPRAPRTWRTRKDPFAEVWTELRLRLEINPAQTAKSCFRTCSVATRDVFRMDSCGPCRDGFVIGAVSNCTVQRWIVSSHLLAWPEWNQPRCRVLEPCRAVRAKGAGRATGAGTAQRPQRIH